MSNENAGENQESNQESLEQKVERLRAERDAVKKDTETLKAQKSHWKKKAESKPNKVEDKPKEKSSDTDYSLMGYLNSEGIKGKDKQDFAKQLQKETGKDWQDLVDMKYFKDQMKEFDEKQTTKKATPSSSKRSTPSTRDSVDYWIKKGELPPPDQMMLRREVVKRKREKIVNEDKFTGTPVVG